MSLPYSDICQEEIEILDHCAMNGEVFEDYYDELRQAAFDHYWDGETKEDEWKENAWQEGYKSYKNYCDEWKARPLHASLERGCEDYFKDAVQSGADLHFRDPEAAGLSLLQLACAHGRTKSAGLLIEHGAEVNDAGAESTPLMLAAANGHTETADLLLKHGADVDKQHPRTGETAFEMAVSGGRQDTALLLKTHRDARHLAASLETELPRIEKQRNDGPMDRPTRRPLGAREFEQTVRTNRPRL